MDKTTNDNAPVLRPRRIRSPKGIFVLISILFIILTYIGGIILSVPLLLPLWIWVMHTRLRLTEDDIVLFWGLPGSGKTLHLTKVCKDNKKRWKILGNPEYAHCALLDGVVKKDQIGVYDTSGSLIVWDEASLNGWDNRTWATNFSPESLDYWKKHRQYKSPIVLTNQGWDELDVKIRGQLCNQVYYCYKNKLLRTCTAVKLYKRAGISADGQPVVYYRLPTLLDRLVDPSCVLRASWRKYGKYYNTCTPRKLKRLPNNGG